MLTRLYIIAPFECPSHGIKSGLSATDSSGHPWCTFEEGRHGTAQAGVSGVWVKMKAGPRDYKFFFPWSSILCAEVDGK